MKSLLATFYLVTFDCADATLTDCDIYQSKPMSEAQCAAESDYILRMAREFQLPGAVLAYCTEDVSNLPINED
jgi:hypothetical protein